MSALSLPSFEDLSCVRKSVHAWEWPRLSWLFVLPNLSYLYSPRLGICNRGKGTIGIINQCLSITHQPEKGLYSLGSLYLTWKRRRRELSRPPLRSHPLISPRVQSVRYIKLGVARG